MSAHAKAMVGARRLRPFPDHMLTLPDLARNLRQRGGRMNADEEMGPTVETPVGGRNGSTLTPALIDHLMRVEGKTIDQIAAEWHVAKSTISYRRTRHGRYKKPREQAMEYFPWPEMDGKFKESQQYQDVTRHLQYMVAGPDTLSGSALYRLRLFYNRLINDRCVLVFDPEIPPGHRRSKGGWAFVPRIESDGDLIIRVNEHTSLTDESRGLMRLPEELPEG